MGLRGDPFGEIVSGTVMFHQERHSIRVWLFCDGNSNGYYSVITAGLVWTEYCIPPKLEC